MATQIDKLTFTFTERPTFRHGGQEIDLAKAAQTLVVKDKNGNDKTITGFQSDTGTFFQLKIGTDGFHKIRAYGTPEALAMSNLKVRQGDITKARFGDERFVGLNPFKPRELPIGTSVLGDAREFAKRFDLQLKAAAQELAASTTHAPRLADDTPITRENKALLRQQPGLESFFDEDNPTTADLRRQLASLLAAQAGQDKVPEGATALEFLDDGTVTVGQLKTMVDTLSVSRDQSEPELQAAPARPAERTGSGGAGPVAKQAPAQAPKPADVAKALTAQLRHDLGAATSLTRQGELEAQLRMLDTGTLYMDPEITSLSTIYEAKAQAVHPGTLFTAAVSEAQAARAGQDIMGALEHSGLLGQPFRMAIPIHTGNAMNGHWTGAFVSFDPNAAPGTPKVKIQTVDSLSTASSLRTLNPTLQATLKAVFGNDILGGGPVEIEAVMPKHRQNDGTSCGACTMENLLDLAAGPSAAQPFAANDMLALRLHQVQTLLPQP